MKSRDIICGVITKLLLAHGFKDGPRMLDRRSAKSMGMISPSGFVIGLIEHKKNHD